jgi:hypothetical protein
MTRLDLTLLLNTLRAPRAAGLTLVNRQLDLCSDDFFVARTPRLGNAVLLPIAERITFNKAKGRKMNIRVSLTMAVTVMIAAAWVVGCSQMGQSTSRRDQSSR